MFNIIYLKNNATNQNNLFYIRHLIFFIKNRLLAGCINIYRTPRILLHTISRYLRHVQLHAAAWKFLIYQLLRT